VSFSTKNQENCNYNGDYLVPDFMCKDDSLFGGLDAKWDVAIVPAVFIAGRIVPGTRHLINTDDKPHKQKPNPGATAPP